MKRLKVLFALSTLVCGLALTTPNFAQQPTPKVDTALAARLTTATPTDLFGVILTFEGERIAESQVAAVAGLGISGGYRMSRLPIMAVNANAAQIKQLTSLRGLRSIYLNAPVELYLHQTKPLIGVTRLRADADITRRNGGRVVNGRGVTVVVNDTGIDGTHPDVAYNTLNPTGGKTIQNVLVNMSDKDGLLVRPNSTGNLVEGIVPPVYVENVANTDTHGGHGTHVASTVAGTGEASGNLYQGVAPGASLVGLGSGAGLFIVGQIAAFDYCLANQIQYNIRVVNNSWGNSAAGLDPDHPINVATRALYDANIVVVFASGNDGPDPNSQNRWASWPWVISVGATTKDGRIADFSSRGDFDTDIRPTIVTPGTGGPVEKGFTSAVVAARSRANTTGNGLHADAEIPTAFLPNYTQISGTSMAAPHLAGVVANILSANPALSVDDVQTILERTATPLSVYDAFEAGAGLANVHAAVDLAFNASKAYGNYGFAGKGLTLRREDASAVEGSVAAGGAATHEIQIPAGSRFTFVQLDWGAGAEGEAVVDNTNVVLNDLSLTVLRDGRQVASSADINLGGLFGAREAVKLEFPESGLYTVRVSAGLAGAGVVASQPYTVSLRHYLYDTNQIADLGDLDSKARTEVYRLVYDRVMGVEGGFFRPSETIRRGELARALMIGARVPQFIPNKPSFTDIATGTPDALYAESLRKEGVMGLDGSTFGANVEVNRLEQAVAMVRALRMDAQARTLAGTTVKSGGEELTDGAQIPSHLRGYVQIALDKGLIKAEAASMREVAPGQFVLMPGPRFEPARRVTRAEFASAMTRLLAEMFGE